MLLEADPARFLRRVGARSPMRELDINGQRGQNIQNHARLTRKTAKTT
jgi:hypothetical protein